LKSFDRALQLIGHFSRLLWLGADEFAGVHLIDSAAEFSILL